MAKLATENKVLGLADQPSLRIQLNFFDELIQWNGNWIFWCSSGIFLGVHITWCCKWVHGIVLISQYESITLAKYKKTFQWKTFFTRLNRVIRATMRSNGPCSLDLKVAHWTPWKVAHQTPTHPKKFQV